MKFDHYSPTADSQWHSTGILLSWAMSESWIKLYLINQLEFNQILYDDKMSCAWRNIDKGKDLNIIP